MKIRIAVAVGPDGKWRAFASNLDDDDTADETALILFPPKSRTDAKIYWISAEVPDPQPVEIEGRVE